MEEPDDDKEISIQRLDHGEQGGEQDSTQLEQKVTDPVLAERQKERLGLSKHMVLMVVVMEGKCSPSLHFVWYFIFLT